MQQRTASPLPPEPTPSDPFASAVRASSMAMVVTDARQADNPIIFVNDAFTRLTGYSSDDVLGRNCRFMQGEGTRPDHIRQIADAVEAGQDIAIDIINYRKDGCAFWNALYISPVRDAAGEIAYFFGAQLDASDKKHAELAVHEAKLSLEAAVEARTRDLTQSLEQKSALLHEIDHRVKNNLQLISALITLQIRRSPDRVAREALRNTLERVSAIGTVHRRLFQDDDVERFDLAAFLRDLVDDRDGEPAPSALTLPPVAVPAVKAAPLALIVNELLAYALADGPSDSLRLSVERDGEGFRIRVEGAGGTAPPDPVGREIVDLLGRQLGAVTSFDDADGARRACLSLPAEAGRA